jgi:hypothetical protein
MARVKALCASIPPHVMGEGPGGSCTGWVGHPPVHGFAPPERIAVRAGGVRGGFHACMDTLDRLGPPWTACRVPIC